MCYTYIKKLYICDVKLNLSKMIKLKKIKLTNSLESSELSKREMRMFFGGVTTRPFITCPTDGTYVTRPITTPAACTHPIKFPK